MNTKFHPSSERVAICTLREFHNPNGIKIGSVADSVKYVQLLFTQYAVLHSTGCPICSSLLSPLRQKPLILSILVHIPADDEFPVFPQIPADLPFSPFAAYCPPENSAPCHILFYGDTFTDMKLIPGGTHGGTDRTAAD
jgi:hypothetical protein